MLDFSIIIPVYNRVNFIGKAIESSLAQVDVSFEIIIVDNGSNDGTIELVEKYCKENSFVKLLHCNYRGVSFARNKGIANSNSNFIHILDSDNYFKSNTSLKTLFDIFSKLNYKFDFILTPNIDEKNNFISYSPIYNDFISSLQYIETRGEFSITANSIFFKENLHPEILGITHEILFPTLYKSTFKKRVYISSDIIQIYSTNANDRLSSPNLNDQQIVNYQFYYYLSYQSLNIRHKLYCFKILVKFLFYNRISNKKLPNQFRVNIILKILIFIFNVIPNSVLLKLIKRNREAL